MTLLRSATLAVALAASTLLAPSARAEATTVHVSLWDLGDEGMDHGAMPMGMAMSHGAGMMATKMGVKIDMAEVPAGEVTFDVANDSAVMEHEMIVSPVADRTVPLPYDTAAMKVDEEAAGAIDEVSELQPGATGQLTLSLTPGTYILYCNIKGHYAMGMWTLLTVR